MRQHRGRPAAAPEPRKKSNASRGCGQRVRWRVASWGLVYRTRTQIRSEGGATITLPSFRGSSTGRPRTSATLRSSRVAATGAKKCCKQKTGDVCWCDHGLPDGSSSSGNKRIEIPDADAGTMKLKASGNNKAAREGRETGGTGVAFMVWCAHRLTSHYLARK